MQGLHETMYGKTFFEHQLPTLIESLERIAVALEKNNELREKSLLSAETTDPTTVDINVLADTAERNYSYPFAVDNTTVLYKAMEIELDAYIENTKPAIELSESEREHIVNVLCNDEELSQNISIILEDEISKLIEEAVNKEIENEEDIVI